MTHRCGAWQACEWENMKWWTRIVRDWTWWFRKACLLFAYLQAEKISLNFAVFLWCWCQVPLMKSAFILAVSVRGSFLSSHMIQPWFHSLLLQAELLPCDINRIGNSKRFATKQKYFRSKILSCNYIFPSEDILQDGLCLSAVPQKLFRYYRDGDSVKTCIKSVKSCLDVCTLKGDVKLTLCIKASAEACCELLYVVLSKVYSLL